VAGYRGRGHEAAPGRGSRDGRACDRVRRERGPGAHLMRIALVAIVSAVFGLVSRTPVARAQSPPTPPLPQTAIVVDVPAPVLLMPDGTPAAGAAAAIAQS